MRQLPNRAVKSTSCKDRSRFLQRPFVPMFVEMAAVPRRCQLIDALNPLTVATCDVVPVRPGIDLSIGFKEQHRRVSVDHVVPHACHGYREMDQQVFPHASAVDMYGHRTAVCAEAALDKNFFPAEQSPNPGEQPP